MITAKFMKRSIEQTLKINENKDIPLSQNLLLKIPFTLTFFSDFIHR